MTGDAVAKVLATSLAGLGASLVPALSFGLGLGDIQVESRLNQPLYARIEVSNVTDDEWRQMRARVAPRMLSSEGSVRPEILASLTLRAVENGKGRHFIEVKSGEVLTEPLFDLPVEIAGQSLQVVRNYSVLLDPATSDDSPQGMPPELAQPASAAAQLDAHGNASRRHHAHDARDHMANVVRVAQVAAVDAARPSGQNPLAGQLATLQQTLTEMQGTIASQNVEIARLSAQVAARSGASPLQRPSTWVEYPARTSEASSGDGSDARSSWLRTAMFYWIGGAIVGLVALVFGVVGLLRWRHAKMLREIALQEVARRQPPPKPAVAPTSERDLLAWQSNLSAARSGSWKQSLDSASHSEAPGSTITHANLEYALSEDLEADLETLSASYEAEHLESTSQGTAAWRAQNEMLERDYSEKIAI